jgi:hypothetical protein
VVMVAYEVIRIVHKYCISHLSETSAQITKKSVKDRFMKSN